MTEKALTHREVVSKGGKARWAGKTPEARSRAMKRVRRAGLKKKRK